MPVAEKISESDIEKNKVRKLLSITHIKTIPDTLGDILNDVLGENGNELEMIDNTEDFLDVLTIALWITYPYYREKKTRNELNSVRRLLKDKVIACDKCGKLTKKIEMHHIIPVCRMGGNNPENISFLCHECHKIENRKTFKTCEYSEGFNLAEETIKTTAS